MITLAKGGYARPTCHALMLICLGGLFSSCTDNCQVEHIYTYYEPVYTPMEEIRSAVATFPGKELKQTGKIYIQNGLLFVNEPNEGVHVIDNNNPADPVNIAFINIPGAFDLAVNGNVLFSDSYMDLVAIDISDVTHSKEIGRLENVFNNYNSYGFYADANQGVVTGWKEMEHVNINGGDCGSGSYDWGMYYSRGIALNDGVTFEANLAVAPTNPGMGGSMARFTMVNDYLYAIDQAELYPVEVKDPSSMQVAQKITVDWGIETIFPHDDKLFIGAQNGMFIMDISNPLQPGLISGYEHITSCDPVVVDGNYAYVTLRSGTECQGFTNQLEVIDLTEITSPELLFTYNMYNPHGLGKDGELLFICDGDEGLKIYNAADPATIGDNLLAHYDNIRAFDVIPYHHLAVMIGTDGIYQYDYSDISNIRQVSHIALSMDED